MNTFNVATLSSSALLTELSISQWSGNKLDKSASKQVTDGANAKRGVARVNKSLLAGSKNLEDIKKIVSETRRFHERSTLPWGLSTRAITTEAYFDYHKQMTQYKADFEQAVDTFINDYHWEIAQQQASLGSLFNPDDYPSEASLRAKFAFRLGYTPMPERGDWRLDIPANALTELEEQFDTQMNERLTTAMGDIWQRAHKALANMSERLDYTDKSTRKIFRDTLVDNVVEIVDIMRISNIAQDTQMSAIADKLDSTLRGITPDALREDDILRGQIKRDVDNVIKSLPSLDM